MPVQLGLSSEAFPIPYTPLKGVAEAALYCAHRATASSHSFLPRSLVSHSGVACSVSHCAQFSHPPTHWHAETCH